MSLPEGNCYIQGKIRQIGGVGGFIYHGPPKPTCLEVFMVDNMVSRWPKPLFFMVLGLTVVVVYPCFILCSTSEFGQISVQIMCIMQFCRL